MIEKDTHLYDVMDVKYSQMKQRVASKYGLQRAKSNSDEMIALHFAHSVLMSVVETFVIECRKELDSGYVGKDIYYTQKRIKSALSKIDLNRVSEGDSTYYVGALKSCIDILATPTEIELELDQTHQTCDMWLETIGYFRQIQTFFEAKITF